LAGVDALLSTPSLGITSLAELDTNTNKHIAGFQLPLSGSLTDYKIKRILFDDVEDFQLPLSGSRAACLEGEG